VVALRAVQGARKHKGKQRMPVILRWYCQGNQFLICLPNYRGFIAFNGFQGIDVKRVYLVSVAIFILFSSVVFAVPTDQSGRIAALSALPLNEAASRAIDLRIEYLTQMHYGEADFIALNQ
jgi:hypothetical protein